MASIESLGPVLFLVSAASTAGAAAQSVDVQSVDIDVLELGDENASYSPQLYEVEITVKGTGIDYVQVDLPDGSRIALYDQGGSTYWDTPAYMAGNGIYRSSDYKFFFRGLGSVTSDYTEIPFTATETLGFAQFSWPTPLQLPWIPNGTVRPAIAWDEAVLGGLPLGDYLLVEAPPMYWSWRTCSSPLLPMSERRWMLDDCSPALTNNQLWSGDVEFRLTVVNNDQVTFESTLGLQNSYTLYQSFGHANHREVVTPSFAFTELEVESFIQMGDNPPVWVELGELEVETYPGPTVDGPDIEAWFEIHPQYVGLMDRYDFRWINLMVGAYGHGDSCDDPAGVSIGYGPAPPGCNSSSTVLCGPELVLCGEEVSNPCLGLFPAFDPRAGTNPCPLTTPLDDELPFYWSDAFRALPQHSGRGWVHFEDDPGGYCLGCVWTTGSGTPTCNEAASPPVIPTDCLYAQYEFYTYLVATSDTDPALAGNRFVTLAGFEWRVDNYADQAVYVEVLDHDELDVLSQAIANSALLDPSQNFTGWTPLYGVPLQFEGRLFSGGPSLKR